MIYVLKGYSSTCDANVTLFHASSLVVAREMCSTIFDENMAGAIKFEKLQDQRQAAWREFSEQKDATCRLMEAALEDRIEGLEDPFERISCPEIQNDRKELRDALNTRYEDDALDQEIQGCYESALRIDALRTSLVDEEYNHTSVRDNKQACIDLWMEDLGIIHTDVIY